MKAIDDVLCFKANSVRPGVTKGFADSSCKIEVEASAFRDDPAGKSYVAAIRHQQRLIRSHIH
jgi:hypothetical protein